MTKNPTPTEKSKKEIENTKTATKNLDYTTIVDRIRTVSWSKNSHPTCVVKPIYESLTFPPTATAMFSEGLTFKNLEIILLIKTEDQQPTKAERP